jgi:hypothetical protein
MDLPTVYYLPTMSSSTTTLATGFEYAPLQPPHIRLLSLERGPSPKYLTSRLLLPILLDDRHLVFLVLIYVWDGSIPTHTIAIDGKPFAIARSLCDFLVRTPTSNDSIF